VKIIIYGFGNPGRGDDGLGVRIAQAIENEAASFEGLELRVESNYQLNIEDALAVSGTDMAIFCDAAKEGWEPFDFNEIFPSADVAFTTHTMSPASVIALCEELYGRRPKSYLLAIRGYEWGITETLSQRAAENLASTLGFLKGFLSGLAKAGETG
jgi:hydrogenase maturation protease